MWYDAPNDALIYDWPEHGPALPYLENPTPLHNDYVAVPVSLHNLQVLRHFNKPVIPIVDDDYDWPIKAPFRPREHQKQMTNFMVLHPRSFNLSDMGTMKTLATLWAADYVMQQYPGTKAVISCPLSIMQRVWGDAISQHFLGRRTYQIVHHTSAAQRSELLKKNVDFYITNHDGMKNGASTKKGKIVLGGFCKALAEREDIRIAIVDEASAYRDGQTARHRITRAVLSSKPYLWPLTGTPTPNGPLDAHGLSRLIRPPSESFTSYKQRVMFNVGGFKWLPRVGAHEEAYKLLSPSIRFEMRDCTDVPPCTEQMRDVELSPEQADHYQRLKRDLVLTMKDGTQIDAVHQAALRMKLIQISCGAIYDHDHKVTRLDCTPRINELKAVIEEAHRKVIVFAPLTSVVHLLYDKLTDYSRAMINGEVPTKARDEIFRRFQSDADPQVLIADPATMSHGLDLFAASVIVWYGATDRTELYLQANRRIDRPGQTVPTTIVQLAATPVEREIFKRAESNTSMQGAILKMVTDT